METSNNIKQKAVSSFKWGFIENISYQFITFIVGIILARLISPAEFGIVGMVTILFAITQTLIDSGFSQALIRKQDCNDTDYSTVFYFNLIISIIIYLILFATAPYISNFFNEPTLVNIVRILSLIVILSGFSTIQQTIRTKRLDFKLQTKISVIATIISGTVGIYLAYAGFGVWSLVWKTITQQVISSCLLWYWNNWKPKLLFSIKSFNELFGFGSKLLISGLVNTIFNNIYYVTIGKYFSAEQLGYYTRADAFKKLPSDNITTVVQRVSYPILSTIQDDNEKLLKGFRKLVLATMFISFTSMFGMAAVAENLVLALIGPEWKDSIIYLQLLCFAGMIYPIQILYLTILKVKGRSDYFLKLEIIKKVLTIPVILIGIKYGMIYLVLGIIVNSIISAFLNSYGATKVLRYPMKQQIMDLLPIAAISLFMALIIILLGLIIQLNVWLTLIIQIIVGVMIIIIISELLKNETYFYLKEIVKDQVKNINIVRV